MGISTPNPAVFSAALDRLAALLADAERAGIDRKELLAAALNQFEAGVVDSEMEDLRRQLPPGAMIFNALSPAERKQLQRQRQKDHMAVLIIAVDFFLVSEFLVDEGYLDPTRCENREATAKALEQFLADSCGCHA